jgi:hypothetical protein
METIQEFYAEFKRGRRTIYVIVEESCDPKNLTNCKIIHRKLADGPAIPAWRTEQDALDFLGKSGLGGLKVVGISWSTYDTYLRSLPNSQLKPLGLELF